MQRRGRCHDCKVALAYIYLVEAPALTLWCHWYAQLDQDLIVPCCRLILTEEKLVRRGTLRLPYCYEAP